MECPLHRLFWAIILLVLCFIPLRAESVLPEKVKLLAKLNLFADQASTPKYFLQDYKQAAAKLDFDFSYQITEDFSLNFLPFVQTSYDINDKDRTQTLARIWQVYLNYKLNNFDFTVGRFDFTDKPLTPIIYYGDDLPKDLALPTSLDGIKHNFTSKYFDYSLLAAEEAQIIEYQKAKLAGAKITAKPFSWLNIAGFYFYQNKKYTEGNNNNTSNISVYGGRIDLFLSQNAGLNFYYAHNGGDMEIKRPTITFNTDYKGYTFGGELYFNTLYKAGTLNSKVGFYIFSDKKDFYSLPNKLNTGIIYGGMNYGNSFPTSPKIIYADFVFTPAKYSFLYAGASVYIYASQKQTITNHTYYAQEINLTAGVKFDNWGIKLSGGLFEGEAVFLNQNSAEQQRIKKLQANFFYKFGL